MSVEYRKVVNITAYVTGVKNRCRKSDFHSFKVAKHLLPEDIQSDQAKEDQRLRAINVIRSNMKTFSKGYISIQEVELSHQNGFTCEKHQLFTDEKLEISVEEFLGGVETMKPFPLPRHEAVCR